MDANKLILADHRQPAEVNEGLERRGYTVMVRELKTGDYIWTVPGGRAGLEVKDFNDLLSSHRNGRLDEQLYRLRREFRLPLLLALGMYDTDLAFPENSGWSAIGADNMFIGREMRGIVVVRACPGYGDAPERIDHLVTYTKKVNSTKPRHRSYVFSAPALTRKEEVVYGLLASVKGVRDKEGRAKALAAEHTLAELFTWEEEQWREAKFTKMMAGRLSERLR